MSTPLLVGLDMGTSSAKAVVLTLTGEQRGLGRAPMHWRTAPGRSEMAVESLIATARKAVTAALAQVDGPVVALGVTGMGESGAATDQDGAPLAPVIAWHDERDALEVEELEREVGTAALGGVAGLPLRRQWTLTKMRWLRRHAGVPRLVRWSNVAEIVVRAFGGRPGADLSLASRTGWLDVVRGQWWDEALDFSGISADGLPELLISGTPLGTADASVPALRGAVLTTAGHDHQAAAVAVGAAAPRQVLDSSGTAQALVRTIEAGSIEAAQIRSVTAAGTTVGWHVLPERWCLLAATEGGLALSRLLRLLGVDRAARPALDRAALAVAGTEGLALEGVGGTALSITGIGDEASPGALWRVATDTVSRQSADLLRSMNAVVGDPDRIVVTGGWSFSAAVMAAKRQYLGPIERSDQPEPGARGAALIAGKAAGVLDIRRGIPLWQTDQGG